jgi:hypothetical protein
LGPMSETCAEFGTDGPRRSAGSLSVAACSAAQPRISSQPQKHPSDPTGIGRHCGPQDR